MNSPLVSTPSIASRIRGRNGSYCALTSTSGIGRTARKSRRPYSPHDQVRQERRDRGGHSVVGEAEVTVKTLVARAEPVAGSRERTGPDRRSDQRQHAVAPQGHPEDPGRDRDEGPDHGSETADQDREIVPAVEPTLCPIELLRVQMEPASTALEQRTPSIASDRPASDRADEVAKGAGEGHGDIGPRMGGEARSEDVDVLAREGSRCQRARVEAMVSDQRGEGARKAGDRHPGGAY